GMGQPGQLRWAREAGQARALDRDLGRIVTAEERGIDHDAVHDAGAAEPNDRPVVPGFAAAPSFPAVVDLALVAKVPLSEGGRIWLNEVLLFGEQLVIGVHDAAA